MKNLLCLIVLIFLLSCEEDKPDPTLTGWWDLVMTEQSGSSLALELELTQQGKQLSGYVFFKDPSSGSSYNLPLNMTTISGNSVVLFLDFAPSNIKYSGTFNTARDRLDGEYQMKLQFDYSSGTWWAVKKY